MLRRHWLRVADPSTDDVDGEVVRQLGLSGATKVLEQLGSLLQTAPLDDPKQLVPNVDGEERRLRLEWKSRRELAMMLD